MNPKQWLLITAVVILNIIVFGTLFGDPTPKVQEPTPTWTPYPTFTPIPQPTATAILMPTVPPPPPTPTPVIHIVVLGETLETIAQAYGVNVSVLQDVNGLSDDDEVRPGDALIIPLNQ